MLLELATFHRDAIEIASRNGINRIELCSDYRAGGVSPDDEFFTFARETFKGTLFVMIRPRPGNFNYQPSEVKQMLTYIRKFGDAGADGFVLGCLKNKAVDVKVLELLVSAAGNKPITFHRAIDMVHDYDKGIEMLIDCGCSRVLSTAQALSAPEGIQGITKAISRFGAQIIFIAGGGIRSRNAETLINVPGLYEIHSACITGVSEICDEGELKLLMEKIREPA